MRRRRRCRVAIAVVARRTVLTAIARERHADRDRALVVLPGPILMRPYDEWALVARALPRGLVMRRLVLCGDDWRPAADVTPEMREARAGFLDRGNYVAFCVGE